MKLFPYSLIRCAGIPFEEFDLSSGRDNLKQATNAYVEEENRIGIKRIELLDAIKQTLLTEKENKQRKRIRKLIKAVQSKEELNLDDCSVPLASTLKKLLSEYKNEILSAKERKYVIDEIYASLMDKERANLVELFKKDTLRNALLLSSQTLLDNLYKYNSERKATNKKNNQLEWSMYKYASRVATKTSPFSSFTSVGVTQFADKDNDSLLSGEQSGLRSIVKFNILILRHFIICLKINKPYRSRFLVRCNPSITTHQEYYHFLINKQNVEVFQRLKRNPVVDIVIELLQEQVQFDCLLRNLVEFVDDTEDNVEFFVLDLINAGFIEMHPGFSELDENWEVKLINFLEPMEGSDAVQDRLRVLFSCKKEYEESRVVEKRRAILQKIYEEYNVLIDFLINKSNYRVKRRPDDLILFYLPNKVFDSLPDFSLKKVSGQNIIFEDVLTSIDTKISNGEVNFVVNKINSLIYKTGLYVNYSSEKFDALNFFKKKYTTSSVDLLTFYEDYFKHKQNIKSELKASSTSKSDFSKPMLDIFKLRKKWESIFYEELSRGYNSETNEFHFDLELVLQTNKKLNLSNDLPKNSFSSFFQFYLHHSKYSRSCLRAYCPSVSHGYGKLFSRFLSGFPRQVIDDLKDFNEKLTTSDSIFAENLDSSIFNANHHPPIMKYEIQIPGIKGVLEEAQTISLKELQIALDDDKRELQLRHKITEKRVFVFDLCFQAIRSRSNLYQLLEMFSKTESVTSIYLYNFNKVLRSIGFDHKEYEIRHFPRVVFENTVVLRRSSWLVPKANVIRNNETSELEEFLRLNKWRNLLKIPDEIFVKIAQRTRSREGEAKEKQKKDDYKPQYINFLSPLSVRYFSKLIQKADETLIIEEMLPNSSQLMRMNGSNTITEFLIQWNN